MGTVWHGAGNSCLTENVTAVPIHKLDGMVGNEGTNKWAGIIE